MTVPRSALRNVHHRIPGKVAVSLIRNPNSNSSQSVAVANCTKHVLTQDQIAFAGLGTEPFTCGFALHESDLGGSAPLAGDWIIEADGTQWAVRSTAQHLFGTRWECACTRLTDNEPADDAGDTTLPLAQISAVASPTNAAVASLTITFSEAILGFQITDLSLTLDGGADLLGGSQTLTQDSDTVYTLSGLAAVTAAPGTYLLTLPAAGSGIVDLAGNAMTTDVTRQWVVDTTAPTVQIVAVAPDPRDTAVASVVVQFSEQVTGFSISDLVLTRDGGANLLTASQTLDTVDGIVYTLSGLTSLTGSAGTYALTLTTTGIVDLAGNALAAGATEAWTFSVAPPVDTVAPTATIVAVTPDPYPTAVNSLTIVFSEPVTGVTLADVSLKRDGGADLLTASQTLMSADQQVWVLGNLAPLTGTDGTYVLLLTAAGSGIQDAAANAMVANASETWAALTIPPWPAIAPNDEMISQFGDNGSFDVGSTGLGTLAIPTANWYADWWVTFYNYRRTVRTTGQETQHDPCPEDNPLACSGPRAVTDPETGQPNGPTILNGTLGRIEGAKPGSHKGFYASIMRVRNPAANYNAGIWPQPSATRTADYLPTWINPWYNDQNGPLGDPYFGGDFGIAYRDPACRLLHGREFARMVSRMIDLHPEYDMVFGDNYVDDSISPTGGFQYAEPYEESQCAMTRAFLDSLQQEFHKSILYVTNVTNLWIGDQRTRLDAAADANIAGLWTEGLCWAKWLFADEFANVVANIQYWLAKSWPGGGRRSFESQARSSEEFAAFSSSDTLNRVIHIASSAIVGNTLEITLDSPHYLADTCLWRARFPASGAFNPAITASDYSVYPHPDANPNKLVIDWAPIGVVPPAGYAYGPNSLITFYASGKDVDAGFLHSLRRSGDAVRIPWIAGYADSRGIIKPRWWDWAATHGYALGQPEAMTFHTLAGNTKPGFGSNTNMVATCRTLFAGGAYLWCDFRRDQRRSWWGDASGTPI